MSLSNTYENHLALLEWNNTSLALVGDATGLVGSSTAGSWYVSLHTADPGEAGDQSSNEAAYTSYARVAVARSGAGWTVSGNQVVNAAAINFAAPTGGTLAPITHVGIGTSSSGAGKLRCSFPLCESPKLATGKASNDTLTIPGHALAVGEQVVLFTLADSTMPAGITQGTVYFVKTVSGNDITISTTSGGSTLDITADGACVVAKATPITPQLSIVHGFAAGALIVKSD